MSLPSPAEIASALIAREEMPPEKGDIGPQGVEGKAGEFGPPGPQGAKGDPGRNGTNGSNGNVGPKGATGLGGPRGPKGEKGDKGDEGERGPIGPMGPTGAVGSGKALFPRPGGGSSGGAPSGAAGGDLSGTYPNPSVVDDSHSHTGLTAPGGDIEATLIAGDDAGGQEVTNLGQVTINPDGTRLFGLLIEALAGFDNNYTAFVRVNDEFGNEVFNIDSGGFDSYARAGEHTHIILREQDTGSVSELSSNANTGLHLYNNALGTIADLNADLGLRLQAFTPPTTTSFGVQIYYDNTNGAAYLRLRGKTADDTAVTGRIRLGATVQTYTESNVTTDRAFNANATSIDELADVLGTLIVDLRAQGLVA